MKIVFLIMFCTCFLLGNTGTNKSEYQNSSILDFNRFPNCDELEFEFCDPNEDGMRDILDVVFTVAIIIGFIEHSDAQLCSVDVNGDESVDILDVVLGINDMSCWNPGE